MKVRAFGKPVSTLYPNQEASIGDYVELRVEARHIQITADRSRIESAFMCRQVPFTEGDARKISERHPV